jgi:hypothetical protein
MKNLLLPSLLVFGVLQAGAGNALVVFELLQQGPDVVAQVSGSLNFSSTDCLDSYRGARITPDSGYIFAYASANICRYQLTGGPTTFGTGGETDASSFSGIPTGFEANDTFRIGSNYTLGSPITSSVTFNSQTLNSLGVSPTSGLLGTWTIDGSTETIELWAGPKPNTAAAVPAPLPILGLAAALRFRRRLRSLSSRSNSGSRATHS